MDRKTGTRSECRILLKKYIANVNRIRLELCQLAGFYLRMFWHSSVGITALVNVA